MVNTLDDAKRLFYTQQIPGALPNMSMSDLEALFFANPSAYLKSSSWTEDDVGFKAWTYDSVIASTSSVAAVGTLLLNRMKLRKNGLITGISLAIATAGATLTAGQNFAGLWRADGTLVAITADQSVPWASAGYKTANLVGGPFQLAAGDYYAGLWTNGVTAPAFFRGTNNGNNLNNGQLVAPNLRMCSADVGLTTTPPNPFGAQSGFASAPWFAIF